MLSQRLLLRSVRSSLGRTSPARLSRRQYSTEAESSFKPHDNAFNRERDAIKGHAAQSSDLWRKLSIYVALPALLVASANAWTLWSEHWEHEAHRPPAPERPQYAFFNIRNKPYPWGDGSKTLFWNDKVNFIKKD